MYSNMGLYYTGVGSRSTPKHIMDFQTLVGQLLAKKGYIGRSGSAEGSDLAFELGGIKEGVFCSYIPWSGFNGFSEDSYHKVATQMDNYKKAEGIAKEIHPAPERLSRGALALHTRNVYQVLGDDLNTPSRLLFCYAEPTKTGVKGGTNTSVQLAIKYDVPIFNFWYDEDINKVKSKLGI